MGKISTSVCEQTLKKVSAHAGTFSPVLYIWLKNFISGAVMTVGFSRNSVVSVLKFIMQLGTKSLEPVFFRFCTN